MKMVMFRFGATVKNIKYIYKNVTIPKYLCNIISIAANIYPNVQKV